MKRKNILAFSLLSVLALSACRTPIRSVTTPTSPTKPQATPDTRTAAADATKRISLNLPTRENQTTPQASKISKPTTPTVDIDKRVSINLPKQSKPKVMKPIKIDFPEFIPGEAWYEFKITAIEYRNTLESDNQFAPDPAPDHIFMFFKATVTNNDDFERIFSIGIHNLRLVTPDEKEIKHFPSYLYNDQYLSGKIKPGESLKGEFGFEVEKSIKKLTLKARPFLENKKVSIDVDGPAKHL